MKKHLTTIFAILRSTILALAVGSIAFSPSVALAAIRTNTANWDIAGASQAAATFNIETFTAGTVTLTKTAFLPGGAELVDGATLPANANVDFMIYIDNTNNFAIQNVNIADVLAAADFTYVAGQIKVGSTADCSTDATPGCDGTEKSALYAAVAAVANQSIDAGDVAGFDGADTVSAGASAGNAQLDIPADTAWALVFRATVK